MKFMKIVAFLLSLLILVSCDSDFSGTKESNTAPVINFKGAPQTTDANAVNISWYANDADDYNLVYYYAVSYDTTDAFDSQMISNPLAGSNQTKLVEWPDTISVVNAKWKKTTQAQVSISMPFDDDYAVTVTDTIAITYQKDENGNYLNPLQIDSVYTEETVTCYSRLFVYAEDESGTLSPVISKVLGRTNQAPRVTTVTSGKFGDDLKKDQTDENRYYVKSPNMVLRNETELWKAVTFEWGALDPDGEVSLYYTWEFSYVNEDSGVLEEVAKADGWDSQYTSLSLASEIYDFNKNNGNKAGTYRLTINVKDDAGTLNTVPVTVDMDFFFPEFKKGILVIDDSAPLDEDPEDAGQGNVDKDALKQFYLNALAQDGLGFTEGNSDQLKSVTFMDARADGFELPTLDEIIDYRLVIFINDSYASNSVKFLMANLTDFGSILNTYMDIGGKFMMLGSSSVITSLGKTDEYVSTEYFVGEGSADNNDFYYEHLGLKKVVKAFKYERDMDDDEWDNYDFLGAKVENNASTLSPDSLKIMPMFPGKEKLEASWFWYDDNDGDPRSYILRDDYTVMPGINTFTVGSEGSQAFLNYYGFGDIEDTEDANGFGTDMNGKAHNLYLVNTGEKINFMSNVFSYKPFVGNRFLKVDSDSGVELFRSMVVALPLSLMDDSEGAVTSNIKAMIKWFKVYENPVDKID